MSTARATLRIWGARGSCPVPGPTTLRYGGNTSCVEVELASGATVIFDAGSGLRALGVQRSPALSAPADRRGFGAERDKVDREDFTILLSHRHIDHVMGLAHFVPRVAATHTVRVACPGVSVAELHALITQQLSAPLFPTIEGLTDSLRVDAFREAGARVFYELGGDYTVHALPAYHPGGASILRLDDARGRVLAYAPDNELALWSDAPTLQDWRSVLAESLRGIPLLLHDATYTDDELPAHRGWGHSSAEEATHFAIACGARTLLLTHHHPDRADDAVDDLVERCQRIAETEGAGLRVLGACEGDVVAIP